MHAKKTPIRRMHGGGRVLITALMLCWGAAASAATLHPTQCGDAGAGSLRDTIAEAADGDIVDASQLTCVSVLLNSQIEIPQANLTLQSSTPIALNAQNNSRVLHHTGTGTLRISRLHLLSGRVEDNTLATGGCLHSEGDVDLERLDVNDCVAQANGPGAIALGGGIHARSLHAHRVLITNNHARGETAHGGGISSEGNTHLIFSSVSANSASTGGGGIFTLGGAVLNYVQAGGNTAYDNAGLQATGGPVTLNKTTFSGNHATRRCGAICVTGNYDTRIFDSTLTGNTARFLSAGEVTAYVRVSNSTIAFNRDRSTLECVGVFRAHSLGLLSSIIASNYCNGPAPAYDVGGRTWEGDGVTGTHSLIRYSRLPLPPDTLSTDPRLDVALKPNGGPTLLHALLPDSPAINRGSNALNRQWDQRGNGFPRVKGVQADIGAYELE